MKNIEKSCALFLVALMISFPFITADALAQIQITRNSGQANIDGFLDAKGDVWTVEVLVTNAIGEVTPDQVVMKIGANEVAFTGCSAGEFGIVCEYISPLTDGLREDEYVFQVFYRYVNELGQPVETPPNGAVISADGSSPKINSLSGIQNKDGVQLTFTATDDVQQGVPSVGLAGVEIINADSGQVIQTIELNGEREYTFNEPFGGDLQGEGRARLKVQATDLLGHITTQPAITSFFIDFVPPEIIAESFNLTKLGKFIGTTITTTDIQVDIFDKNLDSRNDVRASSLQLSLEDSPADSCFEDVEVDYLWHCTWDDVTVRPADTISMTVNAKDGFGNIAEQTLGKTLTVDSSLPTVRFFGTPHVFGDRSYIQTGRNSLILIVDEQGAGISKSGIRANLNAFAGQGKSVAPDRCDDTDTGIICFWDNLRFTQKAEMVRIGLEKLEDNAGNQGIRQDVELAVDNSGPEVTKLEIKGGNGDVHDYFQSNDKIVIDMEILEKTGLTILVNMNDLLLDAETLLPASELTKDLFPSYGWQLFTENDCSYNDNWTCSLQTLPIKSGPDSSVPLEIIIQDTAGNLAQNKQAWSTKPDNVLSGTKGKYRLNLLGLQNEENPDFWEARPAHLQVDFVDLDVVALTNMRMPTSIRLLSKNSQAQALDIKLAPGGCILADESSPPLSRSLVYGGTQNTGTRNPQLNLVLEFEAFDPKEVFSVGGGFEVGYGTYSCPFVITTKVGNDVISAPELQTVTIEVPFAYSELGAIDQNLGKKITELKDDELFKVANVLSYVNEGIQWLRYITGLVNIVVTVNQFLNLFSLGLKTTAESIPPGAGTLEVLKKSLEGGCLTAATGGKPLATWVEWIQVPSQILACNPSPFDPGKTTETGDVVGAGKLAEYGTWYGTWQRSALELYNFASLRDELGYPATSLYENMYASAIGLCIPGILYNIEKAREVYCRKIVCYGKDVPSGVATLDSCDRLYDLQMCEFVWGPSLDFVVLGGIAELGGMIKNALTSPLGLIKVSEYLVCGVLCFVPKSEAALTACQVTTGINKFVSLIDQIVGAIDQFPSIGASQYCDQAEEIEPQKIEKTSLQFQ